MVKGGKTVSENPFDIFLRFWFKLSRVSWTTAASSSWRPASPSCWPRIGRGGEKMGRLSSRSKTAGRSLKSRRPRSRSWTLLPRTWNPAKPRPKLQLQAWDWIRLPSPGWFKGPSCVSQQLLLLFPTMSADHQLCWGLLSLTKFNLPPMISQWVVPKSPAQLLGGCQRRLVQFNLLGGSILIYLEIAWTLLWIALFETILRIIS